MVKLKYNITELRRKFYSWDGEEKVRNKRVDRLDYLIFNTSINSNIP